MAVETGPERGAAPRAARHGLRRLRELRPPSIPRLALRPRLVLARRLVRRRELGRLALSPLTRRILVLNVVALGILVIGLGYLGEYQRSLIANQLNSLTTQARIFAGALGESAVVGDGETDLELFPGQARVLLRRLIEPTKARARLFAPTGELIADSLSLGSGRRVVQVEPLPPPERRVLLIRLAERAYGWLVKSVPRLGNLPPYRERPAAHSADYAEVVKALGGASGQTVYDNRPHGLILSVAVPVQRYKRVVGALMVSQSSEEITAAMTAVRFDILKTFGITLLITVFFSYYLGSTIVRPIRRLAQAAERIGPGQGRESEIPDFTARGDEIGDLSAALARMTALLQQRMEAIERFAADVAHEIKNPLSSLRSAVETAARVKDPEQQRRLMAILLEDVHRLDRLISDISDASRLDAELSRAPAESVDLRELLATLADIYGDPAKTARARLRVAHPVDQPLRVRGLEGRLALVFRNLIENAISFSPPGAAITLAARRRGAVIETVVEDEGPGLPEGKLEAVFERFYTERPEGEKFGIHSGLGLSISKQIVEAHGGTIRAENRHDDQGRVSGARFIVRLPAEPPLGDAS